MGRFTASAIAALLVSTTAPPASAQQYKIDPNAPLDFKADASGGFDPATCTIRLERRVELTQDRTRLRAQSVVAYNARERGGCGNIERIEAKGDVFYVTPDQKVRADAAVYDLGKEMATFTGNVVAVQGENVTTSDTLVVHLNSDAVEMKGPLRGVIQPKSAGAPK